MRSKLAAVRSALTFGILLAWVPAAGALCVSGTYSSTPTVSYSCAFGLVNFTVSSWAFESLGGDAIRVTGSPGGTLPRMTGTRNCDTGAFSVSATLLGSCNETYSLSGTADAIGHWTGTFHAGYTGSSCSDCGPQSWSVEGNNPSADVPSSGPPTESLELAAIPNPTYGPTLFRFTSPGTDPLTLEIFDLAGRRVALLLDHAIVPRGTGQAMWQPSMPGRVASGLRYAKLTIGNRATFRKIVLLH